MGKYRTIVADPPWPYKTPGAMGVKAGGLGASSVGRYGAMSIADLCAIETDAAENAHLYLWTTNAFLVEAHEIAEAWGFRQVTALTWTKTHAKDRARVSMGMGYYFRGATEHCLFCVKGSQPLLDNAQQPTGFLWPRLPHSAKPDAFYDLVEQVSPGPYLEIFARRARFGWDYWGNESLGTATMGEAA